MLVKSISGRIFIGEGLQGNAIRAHFRNAIKVLSYLDCPGDGALEGPFSADRRGLGARLGISGALDGLHACDKAGQHADWEERSLSHGYIKAYLSCARTCKHEFGFGKGLILIKAIARRLHLVHRRHQAPSTESTRMIVYESSRVVDNLLWNLRLTAAAHLYCLRAAIAQSRAESDKAGRTPGPSCGFFCKSARQARKKGRLLLDPAMLLFATLRRDHRQDCLLPYQVISQHHYLPGSWLLLLMSATDRKMSAKKAAVAGLAGVRSVRGIL